MYGDEPRRLALEERRFAGGSVSRMVGEPRMITCHQEIISNIAVVGWKPWIDSEQVRRATFRVSAFKAFLRHRQQPRTDF